MNNGPSRTDHYYAAMEELNSDQLRTANASAWNGNLVAPKNADSSLKKNTAFVKKLRTSITRDQQTQVLKDISSLSLKKYQAELLTAAQEGLIKCRVQDTGAAVLIVSALHQRFCPEFTPMLLSWMLERLKSPETCLDRKEEKERIATVKVLLRLLGEFFLVNIFRGRDDADELPDYVAKRTSDALLIAVLKEVLGHRMEEGLTLSVATAFCKRFGSLVESDPEIKELLRVFTGAAVARVEQLHQHIKTHTNQKNKAQIRTGKVLEEWESETRELVELFEIYSTAVELLAPVFGYAIPVFENEEISDDNDGSIGLPKESIWQNDEERRFYQVFPEIPQELVNTANEDLDVEKAEEMNELLIQLETATTAKEVDETVMLFWRYKLTNKASKNRLVKHMTTSRELGRLKTYSRFLKSSEDHLKDVIEEVVEYLDNTFRSQIYHSGLNVRNIMFFSEMMKFELLPEFVIFHKIRRLILTMSTPHNVDILTILCEVSGKFLLSEHSKLMDEMMEMLEEKRKDTKLSINTKMAISNLFLILKPPSIKSLQQQNAKTYTPQQIFLKEIVRNELNEQTARFVGRLVIKANLSDDKILQTMVKLFSKPDKINYDNISPLAQVLKITHASFRTIVIDQLLENILRGLENNDYRLNRIRIAQCKYVAEMLNNSLIKFIVVHDLIFKILTFGHSFNTPTPNRFCELDQPDDYFRIQLVTVILQSLMFKESFKESKAMGKLQVLLSFFDYYIWIKEQPIPKDSEFKIINCFLKYKYERSIGLKEAIDKLNEVVKSQPQSNGSQVDDDEDEEEMEEEEAFNENAEVSSIAEPEDDTHDTETSRLTYEAYERKLQEDEEKRLEEQLEKEFKKMMLDSMQSTSSKVTKNTVDLPQNIKAFGGSTGEKVAFTLVTKSGKNIATKNLALPSSVRFATNVVEEDKRQKQEREKLNEYILKSKFGD